MGRDDAGIRGGHAGGEFPLILGMMMYEGEPAVIQKVLSQLPEDVRPFVAQAARQAFAAHSERVHGTATPVRSRS